jgi:hypothetical protein
MKTLTTTAVRDHECLPCYIDRMIRASGCDNHLRWAGEWGRANRLPGLLRWLRANGGYCDCEVLFNVYRDLDDADTTETDDGRRACRGVPRGVRDPCRSLRR